MRGLKFWFAACFLVTIPSGISFFETHHSRSVDAASHHHSMRHQERLPANTSLLDLFPSQEAIDKCTSVWQEAGPKYGKFLKRGVRWNEPFLQELFVVHVGKTCGSSIEYGFKEFGIPYDKVHEKFVGVPYLEEYKYIFVTTREPMERMASAFRWHKEFISRGDTPPANGFYDCFQNFSEYVDALSDTESHCGQVARQGFGHLAEGYCFYFGGVLHLLRFHHNIYTIDNEHCAVDAVAALRAIQYEHTHIEKAFPQKNTGHSLDRELSSGDMVQSLSPEQLHKLREFLEETGEYGAYRTLLHYSATPSYRLRHAEQQHSNSTDGSPSQLSAKLDHVRVGNQTISHN